MERFLRRGENVAPGFVDARAASVAPSDPGIVMFSSGSTGKVKGILSAHRGVCLQLWRGILVQYRRAAAHLVCQWLFFLGQFWDGARRYSIRGRLASLATHFRSGVGIVVDREGTCDDAAGLAASMPQLETAANYAKADLSSLRYIDADCPIARHPSVSTTWREPKHAYGSTETFTLITAFPSGTPPEVSRNSHGQPTPGASVKIVNPFTGKTLNIGEHGEIAVKGPTLMLGYLGIPLDETLDDEGFFHTSDGGYLDKNGRLFWEGRLNDIIKTGGVNVSPLEIDAVIRACPGVKINQTIGVPDDLLGEMVVTCVVPQEGQALTADDIRDFTKLTLASYKVPRGVLFFSEDELSTTGSAKIKTADLRCKVEKRLRAESTS